MGLFLKKHIRVKEHSKADSQATLNQTCFQCFVVPKRAIAFWASGISGQRDLLPQAPHPFTLAQWPHEPNNSPGISSWHLLIS